MGLVHKVFIAAALLQLPAEMLNLCVLSMGEELSYFYLKGLFTMCYINERQKGVLLFPVVPACAT